MLLRIHLLTIIFVAVSCIAHRVYADASGATATILFSKLPVDAQILDRENETYRLLLQLISQPLIRNSPETDKKFDHVLTDALIRSFDDRKISLRVRRGVQFSNGIPIRIVDIQYSLERCSSYIPLLKEITVQGRSAAYSEASSETWIEFLIAQNHKYGEVIKALGICPILEYKNNVVFAGDLGTGSNLISAGEFSVKTYRPGKAYELTRTAIFPERTGTKTVTLATYKDPQHGLRELQSGGADAIILDQPAVNELAAKDSTIEVLPCFSGWMIRRKGFRFNCVDDFSIVGVGYAS